MPQVIIFSTLNDYSTIETIRLLRLKKISPIIINQWNKISEVDIRISRSNKIIMLRTKLNDTIEINDKTIVWYRTGQDFIEYLLPNVKDKTIQKAIELEMTQFQEALFYSIESICKCRIGSYFSPKVNKINVLNIASKNGLNIPISRLLHQISVKFEADKRYITKSINEIVLFYKRGKEYQNKTTAISSKKQLNIEFPTLFQEYVNKYCEIRVFYFFGKLFAMAIMSQTNEKTKVDFRNYDYEKPNRAVPFNIDSRTARQINNFMKELNLNMGSLDFIQNTEGKLIFLEVNPIGQYGMVSKPCNYKLENLIANKIVSYYESQN